MEINSVIFFIKNLYFVNFLDFVWTWISNFLNFFGIWLNLEWVLKIQAWIWTAKYDSQLISGADSRDEWTVILFGPDPVLIFQNSVQFQTQSKIFFKFKIQVQLNPKNLKKAAFSQQKCHISFLLTQSKSCSVSKFWTDSQSWSNPNSTKFPIVRIQFNPSPVQCSALTDSLWGRQISTITT